MRPGAILLLLALPLANPAGAEELGRLFLSTEQRADLEALRRAEAAAAQRGAPALETDVEIVQAPAVEAPPPAPVRFDGIVTRSDGASTIWVNGESSYDGRLPELPLTLRSGTPARIVVQPDGAEAVVLKPGQRWDPPDGTSEPPPAGRR